VCPSPIAVNGVPQLVGHGGEELVLGSVRGFGFTPRRLLLRHELGKIITHGIEGPAQRAPPPTARTVESGVSKRPVCSVRADKGQGAEPEPRIH
jgi:hypothetical protein